MRLLRKHKVLAAAVLAVAAYGGWATLNAVRSDASIEAPGGALLGPAGEIARFGVEGEGGGGPLAALRGEGASAAPGGEPVEGAAAASISGAYWDEDRQLVVFRLAGEVLDAATGEPVERFRIRARALESKGYGQRRERSWSFAERGEGRFELGGLGLGTWRLEVSAPGYSPKALTVPLTGLDADPYLVVPMTEGTELTGRVVDWRGRPVSEARVGLTECFGRAPSDDCPSVESAADGSFALPRLPEDQVFSIRAEHPRYGFATERNLVQTAGAGEHVVIELSGIARIFGEVSRGAAREPVAGAVVASGEARTESDANGFYELRVPLEARPEAFVETVAGRSIGRAASHPESRSAWPLTWVDADTHVAEVRIDFRLAMESATLFGRVTGGAGRPVAGAELELRNTAGWKRGRGHETFPTRATTDSDGRYRIENVPAQAGYRVLLVGRDGGEPTELGYVNVREEAPVEANFRIASGAIRGRFVSADSGEPLALSARGCDRLGARPPGADTWSLPHCYPDGRFEIGGLAPGRYRLESRLPWMDSPVEIEPTTATVAAGAIADGIEVAVRGEPSVTWRFRILDERGKFLLGAFVRYLVGESAMFTSNLHAGDDGTARMSLDGSVTDIAIDRAGYRSVDLDLEGRDPEEVIEVRLEKL